MIKKALKRIISAIYRLSKRVYRFFKSKMSTVDLPGDHEDEKKIRVQISERDLLCINGCGFYGTPQWGNRCSKCWRAYQIAEKRNFDYAKNRTLLSFDKFEERRKLSTESRSLTLRNILRKSPSMLASSSSDSISAQASGQTSPNGTPIRQRALSPDSSDARNQLSEWLVANLPGSVVQEVARHTRHAVGRIQELNVSADEMSDLLQNFYQFLSDKLNHSKHFIEEKVDVKAQDVMEEVEKYVCVCSYSRLFCSTSDEEVADLSLQERIRSLHWVTAGFLETKIDFTRQAVRDKLDSAITECIDVNSHRRADEKLACLVRCSHKIFEALKESGAPTSADEFLPVLIYILLKGNPPLLQSNVKFISRFALPHRVMSGESGYFFTNLSCALQFVMDMNHDSLKMKREEFEAYTSGDLQPPLSAVNCGCNQAIGAMENSLERVKKLIENQHALASRIEEFEKRMNIEEAELSEEINRVVSLYPSERIKNLGKQIAEAERATSEACSLVSRTNSSRDSTESAEEPGKSTNADESVQTEVPS